MVRLDVLNNASDAEAQELLSKCCGSQTWVAAMLQARPFASETELFKKADDIWFGLESEDWLEAFSHHPRIGEKHLREKFANTADWSAGEQAGMDSAAEEVISKLAQGNAAYDDKFGFVFLVCATGKSAAEMLALLEARLPNKRDEEMQNAANEHAKITKIRLEKI